jgi:hypothetical protein
MNCGQERHLRRATGTLAGEFKDMVKAGIIDPTKVVRSHCSMQLRSGSLVLTTEAIVAEPQKARAGNGSFHGMGDTGYLAKCRPWQGSGAVHG